MQFFFAGGFIAFFQLLEKNAGFLHAQKMTITSDYTISSVFKGAATILCLGYNIYTTMITWSGNLLTSRRRYTKFLNYSTEGQMPCILILEIQVSCLTCRYFCLFKNRFFIYWA